MAAPKPTLGLVTAATGLALLMGLQPATTDIYLPALPALTQALNAPMALAQLTMSALILAFGFGQLFWGPVADRVGRRPALLASLGIYAVASIAGALAASIEALVFWRAAQGLTMAGAVVCSRAMVRDLYEPHEGAQIMALALSGLGVVAITGPVLGGVVAAAWDWRAALMVVALYGVATLAFVVWRLPETLAEKNPRATALAPMVATWGRIGRHPTFVAWTLLIASTYGGLFTYLAGSSFVFIDLLGVSPGRYGLAMAAGSSSYLVATLVCRRWIRRHGMVVAVQRGAGFTLSAAVAMALLATLDQPPALGLLAAYALYAFGHGFHMPCGQTGTVSAFPRHAGAASALAGFVMSLVAFGVGRWLALALDGSAGPFLWTMAFWSALTAALAWTLVRRHGLAPA